MFGIVFDLPKNVDNWSREELLNTLKQRHREFQTAAFTSDNFENENKKLKEDIKFLEGEINKG